MVERALEYVRRLMLQSPSRNIVVGISGIDASGKTTFTRQLSEGLAGSGVPVAPVSIDELMFEPSYRHADPNPVHGYRYASFDFEELRRRVIEPIRRHISYHGSFRSLDHPFGTYQQREIALDGPGVLIVEGVFIFGPELRDLFDFRIWLEISFEAALDRAIRRPLDQELMGDAAAIRKRYAERYSPAQRRHVDTEKPAKAAHLVISQEV